VLAAGCPDPAVDADAAAASAAGRLTGTDTAAGAAEGRLEASP
jgi:hypothetical protein